jgi:hypothetical protein
MKRRPHPLLAALAGLCAFGGSGACSGNGGVHDVYMALDAAGERRRTTFFTDTESIYCIADVTGARTGTTVNAYVVQTSTPTGPSENILAVGEQVASGPESLLAFELVKPASAPDAPWPLGNFECRIDIDGTPAASATFDVEMPICPVYPVTAGLSCAGYYPANARCPSADATIVCTCDATTGTWLC